MSRIPAEQLRELRNEIDIGMLIGEHLDVPGKISEGYFRFLCPLCREFNTATHPATNLARCFRFKKNFNPIDMVMLVRKCDFLAAVGYLQGLRRSS